MAKPTGIWEYLSDLFAPEEYDIPEIRANPVRTSTPLEGGGSGASGHRKLSFALSDKSQRYSQIPAGLPMTVC
ncbi:hypothetical protein LSTR_LSTR011757 [Laodelphax striatellus]|uniref:Uncharacterized protein n=1 Tax=Laodelphax striatellus TaxID=195883 RepID=A0A482WLU0_LAOST|nr:hypothetical protein LSTR_LSTR011757 [Laodelphax striatellus]